MRFWSVLVLSMALAAPALAQDATALTADEIARRATERNGMGFESGAARIRMTLQAADGSKRERVILSKAARPGGLNLSLIRFLEPADVQGSAFLLIEKAGDESDDMYLYLPNLKRTRRIAGNQKDGQFMGSDFTYADMENRDIKAATYEKLPDEALEGVECHRIVAMPRSAADSYGKVELWVRKDSFLPQQVKFYGKDGQFQKALKLFEQQQIDGKWVATKVQMWTKAANTSTFIHIENVDTRTPIDPAELTPDNLSKG